MNEELVLASWDHRVQPPPYYWTLGPQKLGAKGGMSTVTPLTKMFVMVEESMKRSVPQFARVARIMAAFDLPPSLAINTTPPYKRNVRRYGR